MRNFILLFIITACVVLVYCLAGCSSADPVRMLPRPMAFQLGGDSTGCYVTIADSAGALGLPSGNRLTIPLGTEICGRLARVTGGGMPQIDINLLTGRFLIERLIIIDPPGR